MAKQLREWTAPEDYHTVRYNPASNELELKALDGWRVWHPNARFVLDHADALNALRADPYKAPPRHPLHDAIVRAVSAAYQRLGGMPISYDSPSASVWVETIAPLIDRERPALGDVETEVLRDELVQRGWIIKQKADVYTENSVHISRRVLIAPERAG